MTRRFIEQAQQPHRRLVINGGDNVRGAYVVDPRNVFVSNTLNAMSTKSRLQQRGALKRFSGSDPGPGEDCLEVIAGGECTG